MDNKQLPYITQNTPKKKVSSPIPIISAAVVGGITAFIGGISSVSDFVLIGGSALATFGVVRAIFPPMMIAQVGTEKPREISTGDAIADGILTEANQHLLEIAKAERNVTDATIAQKIKQIKNVCQEILDYLEQHPKSAPKLRRFMNYYLPTLMKLLHTYDNLEEKQGKGENIDNTLQAISEALDKILVAFQQQLNALFEDVSLDITTDITVMEGIMAGEGLLQQNHNKQQ